MLYVADVEISICPCRCPGGAQQLIPPPVVSVQAAGTLEYNEQEWEQGWATQVRAAVSSILCS